MAVDTDLGQPLYRTDYPVAMWRERTLSSTVSVPRCSPGGTQTLGEMRRVHVLRVNKTVWSLD